MFFFESGSQLRLAIFFCSRYLEASAMATAPATALLPHVDELVLEYLLFRGFTRSFQALAAERKRDRAKGFDVEQITGQLLGLVQTCVTSPDHWRRICWQIMHVISLREYVYGQLPS
jgi:hypothetical protein